jgi:hypothetical protein
MSLYSLSIIWIKVCHAFCREAYGGKAYVLSGVSLYDVPRGHHLKVAKFNTNIDGIHNVFTSVNNVAVDCLTMNELSLKRICNKSTWKEPYGFFLFIIS